MTPGFWTHPKFMDVFIEALEVYEGPGYLSVRVRWWNKSQTGKPYLIDPVSQWIKIMNDHLDLWTPYEFQGYVNKPDEECMENINEIVNGH